MLAQLDAIEALMPGWLDKDAEDHWQSVLIDYHPPIVERLWRQHGEQRVFLHRIHPCTPDQALFHPPPWPSAMRVISGTYEMTIGHGPGEQEPPVAARIVSRGDLRYERTDPDAWHAVRPVDGPAITLMVTGAPWARWAPRSNHPLKPLPDATRQELLDIFRRHYP